MMDVMQYRDNGDTGIKYADGTEIREGDVVGWDKNTALVTHYTINHKHQYFFESVDRRGNIHKEDPNYYGLLQETGKIKMFKVIETNN